LQSIYKENLISWRGNKQLNPEQGQTPFALQFKKPFVTQINVFFNIMTVVMYLWRVW